ncbi:MAG: hypothetical protein FJ265_11825 [Planctomycetes bacterium]|nr:hypothetical protein [Planctomycetota bacterium]
MHSAPLVRVLPVAALLACAALAQVGPPASHWELVNVRSGIHQNPSPVDGVVWREFVNLPKGTPWLRLFFGRIWLGKGSYLRIVSLLDGSEQTLHMEHVEQWQHSSAYFNGDTVLLEIVAGPNTQKNYVEIDKVMAGDLVQGPGPDWICGGTDDRVPSSHAAVGRIDPIGCTGWIIDYPWTGTDRLHLSAGHCYSTGVLEFDVPASSSNCAIQHPPATKQFAIDRATSMYVNGGTGNDYWVFRCFPNSTSGLTTFQTQGVAFQLAPSIPIASTLLRNYGCGVDGTNTNNATGNSCACASPTGSRNQTQQTCTGPLQGTSGNRVDYVIDTCGGSSGSVVIDTNTGLAVAIHTHGGCNSSGGYNMGTAVTHPNLGTAIVLMMGGTGGTVANDECLTALPAVDGVNGPYSNSGANNSSPAWACGGASPGRDIWFRYVASCTGITMFDTCSATRTFDSVLELFAGSCGNLTSIGCNDDTCGNGSAVAAPLTAGNTYHVRVGGYNGAQGAFDLTITSCNLADECTGAVPLQLGSNGPFGNGPATSSAPGWACGPGGRDLWFSYQAPPATVVQFSTCHPASNFDTVIEAFSGSCGALTWLACNDDDAFCTLSNVRSRVNVPTNAGGTLYVRVGGYQGAAGTFGLDVAQYPANDECVNAVTIGNGANGPFSTLGATTSFAWSCAQGGNDVWFAYTATCTGWLVVDTCNAARTFDTALEVFSACGSLSPLGCNDDACGLGSSVVVPVTQGLSYRIRMGGYAGATGQAVLTVACVPQNDECVNAATLAMGVNGPFSNVGATTSPPAWPCGFNTGNDVWFRYVATATVPITFWTCTGTRTFDTVMQVFAGDCNILANLGCNDDWCSLGSRVQINATNGTTYYVRVGGFSGYTGSFDVEVQYGSGTGSITRNAHACGPTTIQCTGYPRIGSTVTTTLGNVTGAPFLGFGLFPGATPFCTCIAGHEWMTSLFGSAHNLNIPLNPGLIGVTIAVQGVDFMGTGGCPNPRVTFTDTMVIVIG